LLKSASALPVTCGTKPRLCVNKLDYIVPSLCVGMHPASLQRCVTQSVTGGIPTQSVGTIKLCRVYKQPYRLRTITRCVVGRKTLPTQPAISSLNFIFPIQVFRRNTINIQYPVNSQTTETGKNSAFGSAKAIFALKYHGRRNSDSFTLIRKSFYAMT